MYQSNQARIKKENPSLLPGRGEGPPAGSLAPSQLSLSPAQTLATITSLCNTHASYSRTYIFSCMIPIHHTHIQKK